MGVAWADYASATDVAHNLAECSNMGKCDRTKGECQCADGFQGPACERMSCPTCTNGRCISMREAAQIEDNTNFFVSTTYTVWDADKIYGCQCDNGFMGFDCSLRACPTGDDPMTTGQVDEVQHLNCQCDGCTGTFALTFRRRTTVNLSPTTTAAELKSALEALDTVHGVQVSISNSGTQLCPAAGATTSITFTHNPGNLPRLQVDNHLTGGTVQLSISHSGTTGLYDGIGASVDGTRESVYCSNRGLCDFSTGVCACGTGFASSNGAGASGTLGDCGIGTTTACPTTTNGVCNGKGTCSGAPSYSCSCIAGFTGYDCSQRTCPEGIAWFDGATAPNTAHAMAPCSNKGTCDMTTGLCQCLPQFTGSACEILKCPGTTVCNGHGTCKTMQQLAEASSTNGVRLGITYGNTVNNPQTWDYNKIQGCDCTANYYMGPYSGAIGDFHQYDCSERFCPLGADPYEEGKVNEKQSITCTADSGTFTLAFREQTTANIAFNADTTAVKSALEKLSTITNVVVVFDAGTAACSATGVVISIEFTWEQGDLPLLSFSAANLGLTSSTATIVVQETQKGTKANIECSARGDCNRETGVCECFPQYLSSDGNGNVGYRGDCGHRSPYTRVEKKVVEQPFALW